MKKSIKNKNEHRFINGTKGVISLFLACLLVPFTTLACSLLTAARINSAVAIFDEALCNASNSTLGTYDAFLRKRFGLLAMAQNTSGKSNDDGSDYTIEDLINETFEEYLKENLKTLSNTYLTSTSKAEGIYPLSDPNILLAQVLEYSKYTVPAKLVVEGLNINDLISYIEGKFKSAFAITDFISSLLGSFGSIITLCGDYKTFQNDVSNESTAKSDYNTKWNDFKAAADAYKAKYDEMNQKIQEQQNIIDTESPMVAPQETAMKNSKNAYDSSSNKISAYEKIIDRLNELKKGKTPPTSTDDFVDGLSLSYGYSISADAFESYCDDYETSIKHFEQLKSDEKNNNSGLKAEYNSAKGKYDSANSKISNARSEITSIKNKYSSELVALESTANTKKTEYVSAISTLQSKIKAAKTSLSTVQGDITSATSSIAGTVSTGISSSITLQKENLKSDIELIDGQIEKTESELGQQIGPKDTSAITSLYDQKQALIDQQEQLNKNDSKTIASAVSAGLAEGLSSIKIGEKEINIADYDKYWDGLEIAKTNTNSIGGYANYVSDNCYYSFHQVVSLSDAKKMWKDFLLQIFDGTLWSTIDAMKSIITTLLAFEGAVNSALNALVDEGYFPQSALPSASDTASAVNENDKNKSSEWKDLLGAYTSIGQSADGNGDLMNALNSLGGSLDGLVGTDKESTDQDPDETKGFFESCKTIFTTFLDSLNSVIETVKNIFTGSAIYEKLLVSGYFIYMTSNRTTYTGSNLSGASFNTRGQASSSQKSGILGGGWNSFAGLFGAVGAMTTVKSRCFFGAETEYLFGGSLNELQNQKSTFGLIFLLRLVFDLPSLLCSEVIDLVSSLAPTIIGAVLIVVLYILVEPLIDTLILVNGGKIPIIKTSPFLCKSGFEKLMKCISSCTTGKLTQPDVKANLANQVNDMYYNTGMTMNSVVSTETSQDSLSEQMNPLNINYTDQLFLMTLCDTQEHIITTLADIIQMEGSENAQHKEGNVKSFDISQAYTYIRAEASFTSQEFIKLTDGGMFNSTNRVFYRGY